MISGGNRKPLNADGVTGKRGESGGQSSPTLAVPTQCNNTPGRDRNATSSTRMWPAHGQPPATRTFKQIADDEHGAAVVADRTWSYS